ncbi:MAG: T9SS type A sorting domain-containing protein, partial [Saprospiraceae bacterium]|nr:T9SS type A sorting domain-containing protein [Saprospiraceae bacterium]
SQVYAGTNQGLLMAFDLNGNALWSKDYQNIYAFRGMQARADGFLACGSNNNAKGVLLAFDETGNLQWERKPGDDGYNSLIENADGSIVATGIHISGRAALTKINAAGQLLWRRIYEAGHGGKLLPAIDGGYIFMAHSIGSPANAYVVKTNDLGETDELDENIAVSGQRELSNGGFRLKQLPSSALFFDLDGGSFEIPADSMTYLFFSHSPWIGAVDGGGNLHLSAGQFGETNFPSDYQTGIINSPSRDFNRLWAITRAEIDALQRDFEEDGVLDNTPGYDVLTWPAKGNPYFSINFDFTRTGTHPDSLPAPFVDRNGDGRYHVYDGDYPVLKGDRMLWWVMNDNQQHELSNGQPLRVDIMLTVFAYDCAENPLVQQSVFAEYQVINRSAESYHHSYFGFNTFAELGCGEDDYIGSTPDAQSFFVYNADGFDGQSGTGCFSGSPSFGAQIPVESVTFLDQSLNHLLYFSTHLPGGPGSSDPIVPSEYYNYLQGRWRDNVPLTYGGTGYNPDDPNAVPVNHVFPDNPADPQGWSMCSEQLPISDRRLVSSNGPFVFGAGDTFTLRLAFSFHPDIPHPCPDVFGLVKPGILDIRQWHDDGTLDATLDLGSVQLLPPGQSIALDATLPHATAYEWSNGAITPSISVNMPGEYTVSVTRASGCVSTETVLVKSASGAQAPEETIEWSVQPNPARDVLNIVLPALPENASVRMFNAQGQTVMLRRLETTQMSLQVAHLPAGLYWVELFQDGWKGGSRKVVVTR